MIIQCNIDYISKNLYVLIFFKIKFFKIYFKYLIKNLCFLFFQTYIRKYDDTVARLKISWKFRGLYTQILGYNP